MNDGVLPEGVRHFDQPGSEIVSFGIQTLGGFNNVQSYQGWFAIEILQPVQLQSQRAEFDVICATPSTGGAPSAPQTLQAENDTTTATTDEEDTAAATTTAPEEGDTTGEGEGGGLPTEESTEESTEEPDEGEGNTGEDTGGTPPPSRTDQEPSSPGDDTGG
jgi:cytoskeletal protein RodZ